jgi:FkbM family methyltransferase
MSFVRCIISVASFPFAIGATLLHSHHLRRQGSDTSLDTADDDVCSGVLYEKPGGLAFGLHRRPAPARVVDFIQLGNIHERPILRLRLAEMADLVDDIHIAEANRDFAGDFKEPVLPHLFAADPEIAKWKHKITHHYVAVPDHLSGYDLQRHTIHEGKAAIQGSGVMVAGDLDEIINRKVLRSLRHCQPEVGPWNAKIRMELFSYNMGWTAGNWIYPTIAYDFGAGGLLLAQSRNGSLIGESNGTKNTAVSTASEASDGRNKTHYVESREDTIICQSCQAGWHVAWMLDGADGIAFKIMHGRIESTPDWAAPHATSEKALAEWLRNDFLRNPGYYDSTIRQTSLSLDELPEAMVANPEQYKFQLGKYFSKAAAVKSGQMLMELRPTFLSTRSSSIPCACEATNSKWQRTIRTQPRCIFIDLGAADGNSFASFRAGDIGEVSNCPSQGSYEAYLVEANPHFKQPLESLEKANAGQVHSLSPRAAYMCQGQTSFYLDTVNHGQNYWGSSMSRDHPDVQKSGQTYVTVDTVNLMQLVAEHTIPSDYVVVKMDIEGAEWDILPCLSNSPEASLIDELLVEMHPIHLGGAGTTEHEMQVAVMKLKNRGVRMPSYFSGTL